MPITAAEVSQLRVSTGAGMMDCKQALEEAAGDKEKAAEILRKKGILKAAKRADKVAAEGVTTVQVSGNAAVIAEINSETDFVAKNENFQKLANDLSRHLLASKPATLAAAQDTMLDSRTVRDFLTDATATSGEKISLRRFEVAEKTADQAFGAYTHLGGKISVLVTLAGTTDADLARDVAMHVAAANPRCVRREEVDSATLKKEEEIYSAQLKAQGKPENIIANILKGKMEKFYGEVCLLEQPFIKDEDKTVQKYLDGKGQGVTVAKMIRYELGEGVAKPAADFVAEVAGQLR